MEEEKKKAYSEVVEVLKLIEDEEKMEKIPFEVIQLIKTNSDPMYKPEIKKEIPLEEQNLRDETYRILGWIANKYWDADNIIEKTENHEEVEDTQKIENTDEEVSVYNDIEPECLEKTNLPILASEISLFERIKIKVIQLFRMIFKIKDKNIEEGVDE